MLQPLLNCDAKVHQINSTAKFFANYFYKQQKNHQKKQPHHIAALNTYNKKVGQVQPAQPNILLKYLLFSN